MKIEEVPQDDNPTYRGHGTKAVYALDDEGRYVRTTTTGWEVEEVVLRDVLADFGEKARDARSRVLAGSTSPIEYFLYRRMMDLSSLAQLTGIARWRIRRHMRPAVFARLKPELLARYAEIFRIPVDHLTRFEENLPRDIDR